MNYGYSYDVSPYARNYASSSVLSTPDISDVLMASLAGFLGIMIFFIIAIVVLQIIGMWRVYTKAGEKGWKSIIPFYNIATLFKISGMSPYLVFIYIGLLIPFVNIFAIIALAIIDLYQRINLMKAFKSSTALTVTMILVPFIAYLILGFGKSEYNGFEEKE